MTKQLQRENGMKEVFCRYVTRRGRRIYPKHGDVFHFWVKPRK